MAKRKLLPAALPLLSDIQLIVDHNRGGGPLPWKYTVVNCESCNVKLALPEPVLTASKKQPALFFCRTCRTTPPMPPLRVAESFFDSIVQAVVDEIQSTEVN